VPGEGFRVSKAWGGGRSGDINNNYGYSFKN